ncbi:hypothetical protein L249_3180 [Ophiocordyceps polyrhachis-furcata BCC 54312]|uniref:Uncharacterized protein n=1 Tax=Ophiocordyceps polyrhachis-furcata BCC 54312 TaxID=1330021 RepID=A0A367LPE5_9HYPO|nr:hypothetical protein L249_3180 [Ophiocordyceps polyrhachis-furcata BCC 54312]
MLPDDNKPLFQPLLIYIRLIHLRKKRGEGYEKIGVKSSQLEWQTVDRQLECVQSSSLVDMNAYRLSPVGIRYTYTRCRILILLILTLSFLYKLVSTAIYRFSRPAAQMPITLMREIDLFVCFSWRDWINAVVSTWLFSLGALKDVSSMKDKALNNLGVLIWVTCCMYSFNLFSQSFSLDEDLINKPDRPIPSGKISAEEALIRSAAIWLFLFAVAVTHPQVMTETIVWFLLTYLLGATKPGGHWFGKNTVAMSFGAWAFFSAARKLMAPARAESTRHAVILSIWAGLTAHIQDFRDQRGDRKVGRKTLPLSYGDGPARLIVASLLLPAAYAIAYELDLARNAPLLLGGAHAWLSYRVLACRGVDSDTSTYTVSGRMGILTLISSLVSLGIVSVSNPVEARIKGGAILGYHSLWNISTAVQSITYQSHIDHPVSLFPGSAETINITIRASRNGVMLAQFDWAYLSTSVQTWNPFEDITSLTSHDSTKLPSTYTSRHIDLYSKNISPKMVRSVILLLGLPMLAYCATIPNGTETSSHVKRGGECRTYQDCPPCGFYQRCCLPVLGGGFCQCGTSGRENQCNKHIYVLYQCPHRRTLINLGF